MGKSLSRNIAQKGSHINVYNRHIADKEVDVASKFVAEHPELKDSEGYDNIGDFIKSLSSPRKVFLMVNAGEAVDMVINEIVPLLDQGDIIIDGGNSHYKDTQRRYNELDAKGIRYIGTGVSGGEEGALKGPSIMPGGSASAYADVSNILESIAAKDKQGHPCCAFIGSAGAGHFVKMVHNGIEYAEMQLIAEIYGIMRYHMDMSPLEIADTFESWLTMDSAGYLLEISRDILRVKEHENYLIDIILDKAGNKGTGSWTTIAACELGVAIPTITAALFARYQSAQYDARQEASSLYKPKSQKTSFDINDLRQAYQQARVINHHQGYQLINAASAEYNWNVNIADLSRIWTNGCIIRSTLMEDIAKSQQLDKPLLMNVDISKSIIDDMQVLGSVVSNAAMSGATVPCLSTAYNYLLAYTESQSLANIIQAQRDYFGAHTYERKDTPRGQKHHTQWT